MNVLNTDSYINATAEVLSNNFVGVHAASATWPSDFFGAMQWRSSQTGVSFIKKSGDQLTLTNKAFLFEQMTSASAANELMSLTNGGVLTVSGGISTPTITNMQTQINTHTTATAVDSQIAAKLNSNPAIPNFSSAGTAILDAVSYRTSRMSTAIISGPSASYAWDGLPSLIKLMINADIYVPTDCTGKEGTVVVVYSNGHDFSFRGGQAAGPFIFGASMRSRKFAVLGGEWVILDFA
jgi:hypothetical protein